LRLIWADGGYAGQLLDWVRRLRTRNRLEMEIVKRSKDYEYLPATSETIIYIAMIGLMIRRLAQG
jgi:hypothetical protein